MRNITITSFLLLCSVFVLKAQTPEASIVLSDPFVENNLTHVFRPDNPSDEPYTIKEIKGDLECLRIPSGKFAYFIVDETAIPSTEKDLIIKITFFDEGTSNLSFHYNSLASNGGNFKYKDISVRKTGTNQWVTATIALTDASFRKAQNQGADFRIGANNYIREITITKGALDPAKEPLVPVKGSDYSEFIGKSVAGYQAWFSTGTANSGWFHWSGSSQPRKGRLNFEVYPDVSEYDDADLAQTGFANLGNGAPSKLFNSANTGVINTHFRWMKEYGIDGVAVQRFINGLGGIAIGSESAVPVKIKRAAEANNRIFYICYDISSTGLEKTWADIIKFDWVYNIEQVYKLTESPLYAKVGDKPVVQVWGAGFPDRPGLGAETVALINFLKERGCYVIGGVPTHWRRETSDSKPNFLSAYNEYDMLSPWMVGRFGDNNGANNFKNQMRDDKAHCDARGIDYMPVLFPGFAWSQWNTNIPNQMPRNAGEFMWHQAKNIKELNVDNMYFAMFDEYDEGTALMKAATDWSVIPTDQYFLTTSADGYWVSSDFQLRVAGAATEMLNGTREVTAGVPVPHSEGPVYYRNSFERRTTPYYYQNGAYQRSGTYNIDPCFKNPKVESSSGTFSPVIEMQNAEGTSHSGLYSVKTSGTINSTATVVHTYNYKIADVAIPVKKDMTLSFWKNTVDEHGRFAFVDLITKKGKNLRDNGYKDQTGQEMHPGKGHGTPGAGWEKFICVFGDQALENDTIIGIVITYANAATNVSYTAYFDDFVIYDGDGFNAIETVNAKTGNAYVVNKRLYLSGYPSNPEVSVYNIVGQQLVNIKSASTGMELNLPKGIYLVKVQFNGKAETHKVVVSTN